MAVERTSHGIVATVPARRTQQTLGWIVGFLLPLYVLDESVALKAIVSPLIGASCLTLLLPSRFNTTAGSDLWRLLALGFVLAYLSSLFASVLGAGVGVNAFYPLIFIALCLRVPFATDRIAQGLFVSLVGLVLFGWMRFITGEGGELAEHALGYWGIKYTESTRNSDALAPLMVICIALAAGKGRTALAALPAVRWCLRLSVFISLPALVLTFSRSAWLAAICFVLLNSWSSWRALLKSVIAISTAAIATLIIVSVVIPDQQDQAVDFIALAERFASIYNPKITSSNNERGRLIAYAINVGLEHPLLGAGYHRFNCCTSELGFRDLYSALHPENLFLHLFSEFGIFVGLFSFALLIVTTLYGLRSKSHAQRTAAKMLLAFLVWLQFNSELPSLFMWSVLGVLCSVALSRHESNILHETDAARVSIP